MELTVDVQRETKTVHNVAAYLSGETSEYIVIGAHYDHLGLGDEHSLAPSQIGQIHPGADDNASGTAGVIELARWFAKQPKHKRGIMFLAFAGEELGLLGSEWYVNHPVLPLENAVAMINMDMIGRIRDGKVSLSGTGTGTTFDQLILRRQDSPVAPRRPVRKDGYGASDHTSFTTKQVPVLFFFSGLHGDYHKPSDTADKIDAPDAAIASRLYRRLTAHLETDARPSKIRPRSGARRLTGDSGGRIGLWTRLSGVFPTLTSPPKASASPMFATARPPRRRVCKRRRHSDRIRRQGNRESLRLYVCPAAHKAGDMVPVKVLARDPND